METLNPARTIHKVVFDVCDVKRAASPLPEIPYRQALEECLNSPVEGSSTGRANLVPVDFHGFMATVHAAFNDHRPLVIAPDHIWLLISQGFAAHVRVNAEALRHLFVEHDGKKTIEIIREDI